MSSSYTPKQEISQKTDFPLGPKSVRAKATVATRRKKGEEEKTQLETVGTHPAKNVPKII